MHRHQHHHHRGSTQHVQGDRQQGTSSSSDAAARLGIAVTSSRLWCAECQQQQPHLPTHVPSTFNNAQEYLSVFTPLLLEEAVEGVRSCFEEAERKGKGAAVRLTTCQEQQDGWRLLTVKPASPQDKQLLLQLQRDRDAAVVVLTQHQQQQRQQQQLSDGSPAAAAAARLTGLVSRWDLVEGQDQLLVRVRPWCGVHAWSSGPCCQLYSALKISVNSGAVWQLTPAGSTVTAQRELNTLHKLAGIKILPYLLNPAAAAAAAAATAAQQGDDAQQQQQQPAEPALPAEVADSCFKQHLTSTFDQPQVDAILKCAAHVQLREAGSSGGGDGPRGSNVGSSGGGSSGSGWSPPVSLIQGPPGTGKTYTVLGVLNLWHMVLYHRHYASLDAVVRALVEGSTEGPGSRIDKVLLSEGFKGQLAPRPRILVCAPSNAATDELLERVMRGGFTDKNGNKYNPNMVRLGSEEALSSAAAEVWVEQLAGRLLAMPPQMFCNELAALHQEQVGLTTAISNLAESVAAMRVLVKQSQDAAAAQPGNAELAAAAAQQLENMQQVVARLVGHFERLRVVKVELQRRALVQETVAGRRADHWAQRMQKLRASMAAQQQQHQHQQQQPEQQQQQQQRDEWRQAFRMSSRDLQQRLEASYIEDAEMVFTTLSSSGREVFSRLVVSFPLVLLDEAGQATEVASLQPLVYGARGVVMVGDPQQLPATIFSQAGKQLALERSLFERLAAGGCPVSMLKVQYRMHPAIRTFPSAYFYNNELVDADSVLLRQAPWFLDTPAQLPPAGAGATAAAAAPAASIPPNPVDPRMKRSSTPEPSVAAAAALLGADGGGGSSGSSGSFLLPYGLFDVSGGVEHSVGRSKANAAEAQLAVDLYCQLRPALLVRGAAAAAEAVAKQELLLALPTDVGIVTPYRGQRDLIRDRLLELFGPQELSRVRVETIDSFQGKQLDVVILSLTRANSARGGGGSGSGGQGGSNRGPPLGGAVNGNDGRRGTPPTINHADPLIPPAAAAAGTLGSDGRQMLPLNRAGVGFLSDVRRMNVAITRARLACLILGRVDTLRQDAAWSALVADATARGCLFKVPSVESLTQQQQQQVLLPLIEAARQQQDALVLQHRQQRNLTLPPPVLQQQQQQRQPTPPPQMLQGGQLGLPAVHLQQQQQQLFARQPTPPPPVLQQQFQPPPPPRQQQQFPQPSQQPDDGRPVKQPRLDPAAAAAAAAARAAEEAGRGSRQVYDRMGPQQALVAWGLWPRVVELQQRILLLQEQQLPASDGQHQ